MLYFHSNEDQSKAEQLHQFYVLPLCINPLMTTEGCHYIKNARRILIQGGITRHQNHHRWN